MFQAFPKIPRLNRDCCITEKIDGSNGSVTIVSGSEARNDSTMVWAGREGASVVAEMRTDDGDTLLMFAGSRTRFVAPGKEDNAGFAGWVRDSAETLWQLGPGTHYGEWWGHKIRRGYGLQERRFSLFDVSRWYAPGVPTWPGLGLNGIMDAAGTLQDGRRRAPACCSVVPVLYRGPFSTEMVAHQLGRLRLFGSYAAPDYLRPEGIVVFHEAAGQLFQVTLERDARPKSRPGQPDISIPAFETMPLVAKV